MILNKIKRTANLSFWGVVCLCVLGACQTSGGVLNSIPPSGSLVLRVAKRGDQILSLPIALPHQPLPSDPDTFQPVMGSVDSNGDARTDTNSSQTFPVTGSRSGGGSGSIEEGDSFPSGSAQPSAQPSSGGSGEGSGGPFITPTATPTPHPELFPVILPQATSPPAPQPTAQPLSAPPEDGRSVINEVMWTDSQQSVLGVNAPTAISSNYWGKKVELVIGGYFFLPGGLPPEDMHIFLDGHIPIEIGQVTPFEIQAHFDTGYIPDFYLIGPHQLTVEIAGEEVFTQVLFGEPEDEATLIPEIRVFREAGQYLEIKGTNLMFNPGFSQLYLNGDLMAVDMYFEGKEVVLRFKKPAGFNALSTHDLRYFSPFGTSFRNLMVGS